MAGYVDPFTLLYGGGGNNNYPISLPPPPAMPRLPIVGQGPGNYTPGMTPGNPAGMPTKPGAPTEPMPFNNPPPMGNPWAGWGAAPQGIDPGLWQAIQGMMGNLQPRADGNWSWQKGLGFIPTDFRTGAGPRTTSLQMSPEQFYRAAAMGAFAGQPGGENQLGIANPDILRQLGVQGLDGITPFSGPGQAWTGQDIASRFLPSSNLTGVDPFDLTRYRNLNRQGISHAASAQGIGAGQYANPFYGNQNFNAILQALGGNRQAYEANRPAQSSGNYSGNQLSAANQSRLAQTRAAQASSRQRAAGQNPYGWSQGNAWWKPGTPPAGQQQNPQADGGASGPNVNQLRGTPPRYDWSMGLDALRGQQVRGLSPQQLANWFSPGSRSAPPGTARAAVQPPDPWGYGPPPGGIEYGIGDFERNQTPVPFDPSAPYGRDLAGWPKAPPGMAGIGGSAVPGGWPTIGDGGNGNYFATGALPIQNAFGGGGAGNPFLMALMQMLGGGR